MIVIGKIGKTYGVHGWLKIHSYTEPANNILSYQPWLIKQHGQWQEIEVVGGREHGPGVVVKFSNYDDPESASHFTGSEIAIYRDELPPPEKGEFYWADLEGLQVVNLKGIELGIVDHLFTAGNDIMVIKGKRERLIPFVMDQTVKSVDLAKKQIIVDWEEDF